MSYFLFVDESGCDGSPPYGTLAGVVIEDRDLWNVIQRIYALEYEIFGRRITTGRLELKGKKILKNKVFRHATFSAARWKSIFLRPIKDVGVPPASFQSLCLCIAT